MHKLIERDDSDRAPGCPSDPRHDAIAYINKVVNDAVKGGRNLDAMAYYIYFCLHNARIRQDLFPRNTDLRKVGDLNYPKESFVV